MLTVSDSQCRVEHPSQFLLQKENASSALNRLRRHLLEQLNRLIPADGERLPEEDVVQASAFIRLYCALKGIAGLR